jgi:glycosyltransferase involved in cell wall biosynthesis
LLPHKGIHDLIEGLPPGLGLDVIGPEVDEGYTQALRGLAAGRDVRFRGAVAEAELATALEEALCLVLPSAHASRYHEWTPVPELLGQVLLEAMAAGVPTVCTRVTALPEVVEDGVTGFVVGAGRPAELRSAIEKLANDEGLAARMGTAGRRVVEERFSWDAVARRCMDAYARR